MAKVTITLEDVDAESDNPQIAFNTSIDDVVDLDQTATFAIVLGAVISSMIQSGELSERAVLYAQETAAGAAAQRH